LLYTAELPGRALKTDSYIMTLVVVLFLSSNVNALINMILHVYSSWSVDIRLDTIVTFAAMASIRKTGSGRWQAIIRRRGYRTISKTFPKRVLAVRWARQEEERIAELVLSPVADRVRLSELIEWYLREFTPRKRASQSETSHLRTVSRLLGDRPLSAITAEVVIGYVDERLDEGVGADTIRKELGKLSVVFDAGIALKGVDLPANPVARAKSILRVTKTLVPGVRRDRRPTRRELEILYESRIGSLIEFAVETAMRRGELARMTLSDVNGNALFVRETKTDRPRVVPLSSRAVEIINGVDCDSDDEPLWGMKPDSITQAFERICSSAGIVDLRFHDLRHEGTSRLFERGLSIEEVALITGHENWSSLKRYTHIDPLALVKKL